MKIILDAMGGDLAPEAPVLGAIDAVKAYGAEITLVGRGEEILEVMKKHGIDDLPEGMEIANADDVVDMHDDPASVIHKRKNSSMVVGLRMLAEEQGDAFVSAGSTGALLTYGYDAKNRKIMERRKINGERVQLFQYVYDRGGRLIQKIKGGDKEGCGRSRTVVHYGYDKNGNTTRILFPSKAEIRREYDAVNRLVKEWHLDKAGGIHKETRFSYDRAGNLVGITDNQGRETRIQYDLLNREIRRREKDGGVTRILYDQNHQPTKVIRPNAYALQGVDLQKIFTENASFFADYCIRRENRKS